MRRSIDLDDYDFREVPRGSLVRMGETPTQFDESKVLNREEATLEYELEEPDDPFVLTDSEDDSWGGSVLTLDDIEDLQRRGIPLEGFAGWRPGSLLKRAAKKIRAATKRVKEKLKDVNDRVKEQLKETFDPKNFPGTTENLEHGTRKALDAALGPVWKSLVKGEKGNASTLELLRRMESFVKSVAQGKMPDFQAGPPAGTTEGATASLIAQSGATPAMGWVTGVTTALQIGKGLMDSQYAARAEKRIKVLDLNEFQKAIEEAAALYLAAGGIPPKPGESPPSAWVKNFEKQVQKAYSGALVKGDDDKNPTDGWYFRYIYQTGRAFKSLTQQMKTAITAMKVALDSYRKTTMPKVVQACGNVAQKLLEQGAIKLVELPSVVKVLHKHYQGFTLVGDEKALFDRIAPYLGASTAKKVAVGAGAAAVAVTLLSTL